MAAAWMHGSAMAANQLTREACTLRGLIQGLHMRMGTKAHLAAMAPANMVATPTKNAGCCALDVVAIPARDGEESGRADAVSSDQASVRGGARGGNPDGVRPSRNESSCWCGAQG